MENLAELIRSITQFGITPDIEMPDKVKVLKKLLINLYNEFSNINPEFDEKDFEDEPKFDYNSIRKNVESNFTDFGWYSDVLDPNKLVPNVEIGIGDAVDDLSDIIRDLLSIIWRMENTSKKDALWHFDFLMKAHSEQHLVDLLKYIKHKEGGL